MLTGTQRRQLDDIEDRLNDVQRRRLLALHERLVGRPAGDPGLFDEEEAALFHDAEYTGLLDAAGEPGFAIREAPDEPVEGRRDAATDARRLELHRRRRRDGLIRTDPEVARRVRELQGRYLDFRPFVGDAPASWVDVREALRTEPDAARREALWFAATPLADAVETDVQQLLARRNRLAEAAGFNNFPELVMAAGEFSVLEYLSLGDELEQATRDPYEELLEWIRAEKGETTIEPWDIDYFLARLEPPPAAHPAASFAPRLDRLLADWGLSLAALPIRVDESPLPYGGLTLPVSIPDDIRVLVQPRDGLVHLESWFHEMGHALHMAHVRATPRAFEWEAPAWDEAMAFLVERAGTAAALAAPAAPVDAPESGDGGRGHAPHGPTAREVVRIRRLLAASLFEILAYERPEDDLHGLYSEIHESYLGYPRHPERLWPARALLVTHPVYLPNYVLGRLIAAQLEEGRREPAEWGARIRDEFWRPGAARPWPERVEALTGRPLDPDAWLRGLETGLR
jgi:hypothetical protein